MKRIIFLLSLAMPALAVSAQYKPVDSKSTVSFSIKNFGIPVSGKFGGLDGIIAFNPAHMELTTFNVSVKASTVNTGNEMRDGHLKKDSYFDAEHFPLISFASSKIVNGKDGWVAYGSLTIKNHTKEISIPFNATATGDGYLFKGQFTINRKDFDVGGSSIIGDNASITLAVYSTK